MWYANVPRRTFTDPELVHKLVRLKRKFFFFFYNLKPMRVVLFSFADGQVFCYGCSALYSIAIICCANTGENKGVFVSFAEWKFLQQLLAKMNFHDFCHSFNEPLLLKWTNGAEAYRMNRSMNFKYHLVWRCNVNFLHLCAITQMKRNRLDR